jgi:hypothetical protein
VKRPLKIGATAIGILLAIFGGFYLFIHIAFDGIFTGPFYTQEDLIKNFQQRQSEILEVKSYVDGKIPSGTWIDIEFEYGDPAIFHIGKNGVSDYNWNLDIDSKKTDSLLSAIGWTKSDLETLEEKLHKANCISVSSGNPIQIGWQRSGMGKFFYKIFNQKLNDSLINRYNDGCNHIYYKDNIALEYAGGAIGPQCFPGYEWKE